MAFDDFPAHPTQYFLGEVPLWYTKIDYPVLRRGVQPVEVTFFQPTDAYAELRQLVGNDPVTLRVVESDRGGGRRETEIKGLIVKDVQFMAFNRVDGCRVILSDIRELIDLEGPWVHDINLLENGVLVPGTFSPAAAGEDATGRAHTLLSFWTEVLQSEAPFESNMSGTAFAQLDADLLIPYDSYRSGGLRSEVLQQLLEYWQYDLALSVDGEFYLASRDGSDFGAIQQLGEGDWEWADEEPNFVYPANPHLRAKKYIVPFYERHTMQAWHHLFYFFSETDASAQDPRPALFLRQVYPGMNEFWELEELFAVFGLAEPTDQQLEDATTRFTNYLMDGTVLDRTRWMERYEAANGVTQGSREWDDEQDRLLALIDAIKKGARRMFQLVSEPAVAPSIAAELGGTWLDVELGRMRPDGTKVAARTFGPAGAVFERIEPRVLRDFTNEEFVAGYMPVARNLRGGVTFRDGKVAKVTWDEVTGEGFDDRGNLIDLPWRLGSANPITPSWQDKEARIIRLGALREHVGEHAVIYMGTMSEIPGSEDYNFTAGGGTKEQREAIQEAGLDDIAVPEALRNGIVWEQGYPFYIFVTAKRNFPQSLEKFWTVEVDGFEDAEQDEIVMLPDDHVEMRRNFVDVTGVMGADYEPLEDNLGKPMNEVQVDAQAERRVRTIKSIASMPAPTQHTFYNPQQLRLMRLRGPLDQVVLRIRGVRVECEVSIGARGEEAIRRMEAELQRNRMRTEFYGKVATR